MVNNILLPDLFYPALQSLMVDPIYNESVL